MNNSDSRDTSFSNRNDHAADAGQPPGAGPAGRRAQAARDGAAAVGREASERVAEAARKARANALPSLSRAMEDGARRWSALDPDVKEQVALSLLTSVAIAAGERLKEHDHPGVRLAGLGLASAAPVIATRAARKVFQAAENVGRMARSGEASADPHNDGPTDRAELAVLSEFADTMGVRRPFDPEDLYREGPNTFQPLYPLPKGLSALPWETLGRRDRFFVLVAAWSLREAEGIQLLRSGQLEQAREVFEECLARAQHMDTAELAVRSCEDLGELSVAARDEAAARRWRAEAERMTRG